jgi:hypothetical protein
MGKTWLLTEVARKLSVERGYLVGYERSPGPTADLMLRSVANLYARWLAEAQHRVQAKSLWKRHRHNCIPGVAQAVGAIFDGLAKATSVAGVGTLVRQILDATVAANVDLNTGGLRLALLDYEQARDLVRVIADLSKRPIELILDAWEQSPSVESEAKTPAAFLGYSDEWPLCHVFVGLRPEGKAGLYARELQKAAGLRKSMS